MTDKKQSIWTPQFEAYDRSFKPWLKRMDKIVKRYRDEREQSDVAGDTSGKKINIYYSNVSILQPAIYNRLPQPLVRRRYADKDPVGRVASDILQRCIATSIEDNFNTVMEQSRDDFLHGGRGTVWVRYAAMFGKEPIIDPATQAPAVDEAGKPIMPKTGERVLVDFVAACDFAHSPVKKWADVTWVARRLYLSKKDAEERFGNTANNLQFVEHSAESDKKDAGKTDGQKRAEIWEIWDKTTRKVYFYCPNDGVGVIQEADVPFDLREFFPCPAPAYGIMSNGSLVPVPDFIQYQDQANEMDRLTQRMDGLLDACKVGALYDSEFASDIQTLFSGPELAMIPVANLVAKYSEKSSRAGIDNVVIFTPIQVYADVYEKLRQAREQLKRDIDEITGISDILRGYSAPNATATAEQIKSNFATLRLDKKKATFADFVCNTLRIMGEIISEAFDPETMIAMAGVQFMPDDYLQNAGAAIQLLKADKERNFRIDIETDSTVAGDDTEDKKDRLEFLTTISGVMEKALAIGNQAPELAPLLKESIMFATRSFKAGRSMEGNFEQALDAMVDKAKQPKPPQADPEAMKMQAEQAKAQSELQLAQQKQQGELAMEQQRLQAEMQLKEQVAMAEMAMKERLALQELASNEKIKIMELQANASERIEQRAGIEPTY